MSYAKFVILMVLIMAGKKEGTEILAIPIEPELKLKLKLEAVRQRSTLEKLTGKYIAEGLSKVDVASRSVV